jgi:hypothetical protein
MIKDIDFRLYGILQGTCVDGTCKIMKINSSIAAEVSIFGSTNSLNDQM